MPGVVSCSVKTVRSAAQRLDLCGGDQRREKRNPSPQNPAPSLTRRVTITLRELRDPSERYLFYL